MTNGVLYAAPIPEKYEATGLFVQNAIDQAVRESEANGISRRGKEVTPWLLSRIADLTKGDSVKANIELLKNSANIGEWLTCTAIIQCLELNL
jgi:pseudouridylate synthase / pseudouridine kinase